MRNIFISLLMMLSLSFISCSTSAQMAISYESDAAMFYDNGYNYLVIYIDGVPNYQFWDYNLHRYYFRPVPRERWVYIKPRPHNHRTVMVPHNHYRDAHHYRPNVVVPDRRPYQPRPNTRPTTPNVRPNGGNTHYPQTGNNRPNVGNNHQSQHNQSRSGAPSTRGTGRR